MNLFESFLKQRFGKEVTRNASVIVAATRTVDNGEHKQLLTLKEMYGYVPKRFEKAGMAAIEDSFKTMGYISLVVGDCYGVVSIPVFLSLNPSSTKTVKIGEDEYFELLFEANSAVMESTRCSKRSTNVYLIYNEFVAKPNMPVYFNYNDALLCLHRTGKYANIELGRTNVATEIIIASTTRDATNLRTTYRHAINKDPNCTPRFIGLRNIQYGVNNLTTALIGSYTDTGMDALLVNPAKKLEGYEKLLRM